jgi:chromosomal replication initiator protein
MYTFSRWVAMPENRSAWIAAQRVAQCVCSDRQRRETNPLFVHGPAGTGKTHLISALVADVTKRRLDRVVRSVSADELTSALRPATDAKLEADRQELLVSLLHCDLLVVDDVRRLAPSVSEGLVALIDQRLSRHLQMVFTATAGPAHLDKLPARLTTRLAGGLVVGLMPLSPASRLVFLRDRAQRRHLALNQEVLAWLAKHVTGNGRQLEGALTRLETVTRLNQRAPDVAAVAALFHAEAASAKPSVERIASRVGSYFQVAADELQSRRRCRNALLPRQIGMYLARRLTPLSLGQIGRYFGGRDHSTVLHACRKVHLAMTRDPALSGALRQLHADLA